jgi:hypothetical protein
VPPARPAQRQAISQFAFAAAPVARRSSARTHHRTQPASTKPENKKTEHQ